MHLFWEALRIQYQNYGTRHTALTVKANLKYPSMSFTIILDTSC